MSETSAVLSKSNFQPALDCFEARCDSAEKKISKRNTVIANFRVTIHPLFGGHVLLFGKK